MRCASRLAAAEAAAGACAQAQRRRAAVLVYGANTDVGKTLASAALARAAAARGLPVAYVKPVQTGSDTDAALLGGVCPAASTQTLVHYPSPESPHSAAAKAGLQPIADAELCAAVAAAVRDAQGAPGGLQVVETAGGPLSPAPSSTPQADVYTPLDLPAILVGDPRLGGISATLCAAESLGARGQRPKAIVFLGSTGEHGNAEAVRSNLPGATVIAVPPPPPLPEPLDGWLADPAVCGAFAEVLDVAMSGAAAAAGSEQPIADAHSVDLDFDRDHLWHPYTSMARPGRVWAVRGARGCELELADGRLLVDGMASWWCAVHGYQVPELDAAARRQLRQMSHVMFGGLTHRPAVELGRLLVSVAPGDLSRVFLCDSGSVAVEVALKMAIQRSAMAGRPRRRRIATVRRGYHGDTCGAMSVCDPERGMHSLFSGALPAQLFADPPCMAAPGADCADDGFGSMEELLRVHSDEVAAVIIEPIVQGAGGMRFYSPSYLRKLRALCDELDVLLVFDEIATGFGRTGEMFAAEHAGVVPDIMCIGKALTGGYCTLGAVLATDAVARGVSGGGAQPMMHGPTFMGNPLACSIAAASVRLLLQSPWRDRVSAIERQLRAELAPLHGHPAVADVRVLGAIGVVELAAEPADPGALQAALVDCGVWLRPFGTLVYTMPPFVITPEQLSRITAAVVSVVRSGTGLARSA